MNMLKVEQLNLDRAGRPLCAELAFSLAAGERLAILGRNGAGKSTLLLTLAGLHTPSEGSITLDNKPLRDIPPRQLAQLRSYCPQHHSDAFDATVLEIAMAGRHPHLARWSWESTDDEARARDALAAVALEGFATRSVFTLSGGERQRLALAAQLVQSPRLYLLDEPLSHLDLNHAVSMLQLLVDRNRRDNAGLIAVMHDPNLALRYFDRALLLFDDQQWIEGPCADVLTSETLGRLYGHPLQALPFDGQPWFVPQRSSHD